MEEQGLTWKEVVDAAKSVRMSTGLFPDTFSMGQGAFDSLVRDIENRPDSIEVEGGASIRACDIRVSVDGRWVGTLADVGEPCAP